MQETTVPGLYWQPASLGLLTSPLDDCQAIGNLGQLNLLAELAA